jgi:hypothetical protein
MPGVYGITTDEMCTEDECDNLSYQTRKVSAIYKGVEKNDR